MIKKNYKIINWVILLVVVYILILPFLSPICSKLFPNLWTCAYLKYTGKYCPFCGLTRDINSVMNFKFDFINSRAIIMIGFVLFNVFFRIFALIKKIENKKIIIFDISIHTVFLIYILIYIIDFFK